jgi:hypothetical protein
MTSVNPLEIRRSRLECYLHAQSRKQLAPIEISSCDNVNLFCEITILSRVKSYELKEYNEIA